MTHQSDLEERGTSGSRTPLLGCSAHQRIGAGAIQMTRNGLRFGCSSSSVVILLNTEDEDERDDLTILWRDNKLSELNFVGVVAALLAGVLTSTGSWPDILPNGESSPWSVRTSWYCGIILSLFSILTAADQTVRLHRLSSHRDGLENIRKLLGKTNGEKSHSPKTGRRSPSRLQIFTWQMPVMFLTSATICMIVGMFLHVWSATTHLDHPRLWDDNTKVAATYSAVAIAAVIIFFIGQVSLFAPLR
ncbi:uncharacterized protein SETTUDRAFT_153559 [Exserohilum turcica Et28A]|uniref:Uncharacterized protein n=1 Tax=Exserohilum turcicum (strain 28A) TaxID=671987 RepID=R0K0W5_EXST2|nr:uncharacterized protein SETTUDRAFT_153559 [Exserohilum turcica Et28A]EOA86768.1 hypothetical protein SETTUDRAFT_153559 [Exserohilum turcica Et28A]